MRKVRKVGIMEQEKFIWTVKVGDKGQIVIPKEARKIFNIKTGDSLILFGDIKKGIAIAKFEDYSDMVNEIFNVKNKKRG